MRNSFERGNSKKSRIVCLGYERDSADELVINEDAAKTVRLIYKSYLEGMSLGRIVESLFEEGITSPSGKDRWNRETVDKVLSNEKYIGSVALQKSISVDGKQVKTDTDEQVIYEDSHPAIIPKETFNAVQEEKRRRSELRAKSHFNSADVLSGRIICAECGNTYRRLTRPGGKVVWRCVNRVENGNRVCHNSSTLTDEQVRGYVAEQVGGHGQ